MGKLSIAYRFLYICQEYQMLEDLEIRWEHKKQPLVILSDMEATSDREAKEFALLTPDWWSRAT